MRHEPRRAFRSIRRIIRPPAYPGTRGRLAADRSTGLGVGLHHAKNVALSVLDVRQPSHTGNRPGGHGFDGTELFGLCECACKLGDVYRAHVRNDCLTIDRAPPPHEPAVDARRAVFASLDQPVFDLAPAPGRELPSEQCFVETDCTRGIVGVNFEVNDAWHVCLLLAVYRGCTTSSAPPAHASCAAGSAIRSSRPDHCRNAS